MLADVMNMKWRAGLLKKTPTEEWKGDTKRTGKRREGGRDERKEKAGRRRGALAATQKKLSGFIGMIYFLLIGLGTKNYWFVLLKLFMCMYALFNFSLASWASPTNIWRVTSFTNLIWIKESCSCPMFMMLAPSSIDYPWNIARFTLYFHAFLPLFISLFLTDWWSNTFTNQPVEVQWTRSFIHLPSSQKSSCTSHLHLPNFSHPLSLIKLLIPLPPLCDSYLHYHQPSNAINNVPTHLHTHLFHHLGFPCKWIPMHASRPILHFFFCCKHPGIAVTAPHQPPSPLQPCGHLHQPPWRRHLPNAVGPPPRLLSPSCRRWWELPLRMIFGWRSKLEEDEVLGLGLRWVFEPAHGSFGFGLGLEHQAQVCDQVSPLGLPIAWMWTWVWSPTQACWWGGLMAPQASHPHGPSPCWASPFGCLNSKKK